MIAPPPPINKNLSYGYELTAGIGKSVVIADIDFETYSEAGFIWNEEKQKYVAPPNADVKGLPTIGMAAYAMHPSTEILSCAYDLKDGKGKRLWVPGLPNPQDLFDHLVNGKLLEAWNVGFEYWIWTHVATKKYEWPHLPVRQLRCAMAKARAHALPGHLADAGKVLDIEQKKREDGKRLLNKFSMPRNPTKNDARTRIRPQDDPDDALNLYQYNIRDIEAEAEISSLCPDLNDFELEFWLCDQAINARGVQLDRETIIAGIKIIEATARKYNAELCEITSGLVQSSTEVHKMKAWLSSIGIHTVSLDEENVERLLAGELPDAARKLLTVRKLMGSAAVKKLYAMVNTMSPLGRVHELFAYHSSRTGRAAGRGVQPQNLPNSGMAVDHCYNCKHYFIDFSGCPWCGVRQYHVPRKEWNPAAVEDAVTCIRTGSAELLEMYFGNAMHAISGCLRGMFVSAQGKDFICSDYSAIEAVVLAMLAGEDWRIEVFKTHGMIYETSASKIAGVSLEEFIRHKKDTGSHHPLRKLGKVAELASGYGGWLGAWKNFGADETMSEDEIKTAILAWRRASPNIEEFWGGQQKKFKSCYYGVEGMAVLAVANHGQKFEFRGLVFQVVRDVLYLKLPSGRNLTYHKPRLSPSVRRPGTMTLSFEGWNTNPLQGRMGWIRIETYSGKLTENIVQAVARDLLAHAIVNLERAGYPVVLHVHDEIVCEVPEGFGSVEELESIMSTLPEWAAGWPVKAKGGWRGKRYAK